MSTSGRREDEDTMRAFKSLTTAVGAALVMGALGAASPSESATDNTPPVLTSPVKVSFLVGSQISQNQDGADAPGVPVGVSARHTLTWSATDASKPVTYDLVENNNGEGPLMLLDGSSQTSYSGSGTNADWDFANDGYELTARDALGNAVTRLIGGTNYRLTQENNASAAARSIVQPSIAYAGTWGTSSCSCWSAGAVRRTTAKGASTTATVTIPAGEAAHLALVMHAGPDRGKFQVYVDGVSKQTVDTYAPASTPRRIVWDTALGKGTHLVKIVNLATTGRPRIDMDAILTN